MASKPTKPRKQAGESHEPTPGVLKQGWKERIVDSLKGALRAKAKGELDESRGRR